jgi:hypothetical protein
MQEGPIGKIKLDASSRKAGAFKGKVLLLLVRALNNAAYGSLRLARRVEINENKIDCN